MKNKKLLIGILISLSTVLGACFPNNKVVYTPSSKVATSHEESQKTNDNEIQETQETPVSIGNLSEGEIVNFGRYEINGHLDDGYEPLPWRVVSIEGDRALLMTDRVITIKAYNNEWNEELTWENSEVREWLNGSFYYDAFFEAERERIIKVTNTNNNPYYDFSSPDTEDNVFLLSIQDVIKYFGIKERDDSDDEYSGFNSELRSRMTKYALGLYEDIHVFEEKDEFKYSSYWLRTTGEGCVACYVDSYGHFMSHFAVLSAYEEIGMRPAIWIKISE